MPDNINDLVRTNRELNGAASAALRGLAANLAVKETAFSTGAIAAALAGQDSFVGSLNSISRLIHKEMSIHNSITRQFSPPFDLARQLNIPSLVLADSLKFPIPDIIRSYATMPMMDLAAASPHFSAIGKLLAEVSVVPGRLYGLTALSEAILGSIRPESLGIKLAVDSGIRASLASGLGSLSERYRSFLEDAARPDTVVLPKDFVHLPAVEHLNQAELSAVTSESEDADGLAEARKEVDAEARSETEDELIRLVSEFDPKLLTPIRGAREALENRGTDYGRHVATSLREAFTHALHSLAPDDQIRAWSTSKADFDERDKPTRGGRLRYICRELSETFGGFLTANVDVAGQFIQEFHRATHGVEISITHDQLVTMRFRMEGLLHLMLLAGNGRLSR
jgi:Predicted pPIWI-associating nuclease